MPDVLLLTINNKTEWETNSFEGLIKPQSFHDIFNNINTLYILFHTDYFCSTNFPQNALASQ